MIKIIKICLLLSLTTQLQAQPKLTNNGAILKVNTGTDLRVNNGSIENKNAAQITNDGNIYLDLNFTQTTAANYSGGVASWLWFEGNASQNAIGDAPLNIAKLRVDNGNRLLLGNHVNVSNRVDLTNNGDIELGAFNLNIASGGIVTGYDAANYIITNGTGTLEQAMNSGDVKKFPVGNNSYNPATISNAGISDDFQIRVEDIVYSSGTSGSPETAHIVNRSWHISETVIGGSISDITLEWDAAEELTFDRLNCGVAHWNGTIWEHFSMSAATNISTTRWAQTRIGQSSFSPFVVEDLLTLLPIELLAFDATRKNKDNVQLNWVSASELNNLGFEVERMLESESAFKKVAWVDGMGTTIENSYYNLTDKNSFAGISYYRLKQIDIDLNASYSAIRAVAGETTIFSANIFPNPVGEFLRIRLGELPPDIKTVYLKIMSIDGRILYQYSENIQNYNIIEIDEVKNLIPGMYIISLTLDNGKQFMEKITKK